MYKDVDTDDLRRTFAEAGMHGAAGLVDLLSDEKRQITELGSSSIGPLIAEGLMEVHQAVKSAFGMDVGFFYLGRAESRNHPAGRITPLHHLWLIAVLVKDARGLSDKAKLHFAAFSETFVKSHQELNRPVNRIKMGARQKLIAALQAVGVRISDDLLLGVPGWWKPWRWPAKRRRSLEEIIKSV